MFKFPSLDQLSLTLLPTYRGWGWSPFVARFKWDRRIADHMETISQRRCDARRKAYLIPGELERSKGSIRFGLLKPGRGYLEERKDFCLIGAAYKKGALTVFYRRIELVGGLHFDLAVFKSIEDVMGRITNITIMTPQASMWAKRGNSNEKLFKTLTDYYKERQR